MRKTTVRKGIRAVSAGVAALIAATFFHSEIASMLLLGMEGEARLTFFGFFLAGLLGGFGVLMAAFGLLQNADGHPRVRLAPAVMLLFSLVILFFVLTYTTVTAPPAPALEPGESVSI